MSFFLLVGLHCAADAAAPRRSIRDWVSCSLTSDETSGAIRAFEAARNNAFTLVVDCPVRLHSGLAVDRGIFIDNGTTVEFTGGGKFVVDNLFHPAFVIANSSTIKLTDWNVEWQGTLPIESDVGGYELEGRFVKAGGSTQPAQAFNDLILTKWLQTNRDITFDEDHQWNKAVWVGAVNLMAVFYITGDSSSIVFSGLKLYVSPTAGANHFIPMAFSFSQNWKSRQPVNNRTPLNAGHLAAPHGLAFSGITLDGTLMGWQGNVQDVMFENITSRRYSDLQDANGGNVGGSGKWFPPPHLFYLNYTYSGDRRLFNTNIHIDNVNDEGPRVGMARDKGGSDTQSGYALSLKLGCTDCSVDHYTSKRPDGFMDVLSSEGLTVSNVYASFDSSFIHNLYRAGIRFPMIGYSHITFDSVQLVDTAATTIEAPVGSAGDLSNVDMVFTNVNVDLNRWSGSDLPLPTISGKTNDVSLEFEMTGQSTHLSHRQKYTVSSTLTVTPTKVRPGASSILTWGSYGANRCGASGAWSGSLSTHGRKAVRIGNSNNYDFDMTCSNSAHASDTSLRVRTE